MIKSICGKYISNSHKPFTEDSILQHERFCNECQEKYYGDYIHQSLSHTDVEKDLEKMDVSNKWWYKTLGIIGRIICVFIGHSYDIDSPFCWRCDRHYLDKDF